MPRKVSSALAASVVPALKARLKLIPLVVLVALVVEPSRAQPTLRVVSISTLPSMPEPHWQLTHSKLSWAFQPIRGTTLPDLKLGPPAAGIHITRRAAE